jgi:AcrR family transcriptional regulator
MAAQTERESGGLAVDGLPDWQLARRRRIVEAATRVLQRQEYDQIQIRDVAAEAEVARATLYRYFSSKEHLYASVLRERAALNGRQAPAGSAETPEEQVRAWVRQMIDAIIAEPQFFRALVGLMSSADPNAKALMADLSSGALGTLTQEFGALGPGRAEDAAIMLWSIINTMVMNTVYFDGDPQKIYRIADRFIDLLVFGLR